MDKEEVEDILRHKRLRDEFAMAVLAGILAHPPKTGCAPESLAIVAYEVADAMIARRDQ